VKFVGKVSTQKPNMTVTWVGTTEGRSTNVKHVGRNSQESIIWYAIRLFMSQKEVQDAFLAKLVGRAFSLEVSSGIICSITEEKPTISVISVGRLSKAVLHFRHTGVFTLVRNPLCVTVVAKHSTHLRI